MNAKQNVGVEIWGLLEARMGLSVLDLQDPTCRASVLQFMDDQFEAHPNTQAFMARLCRDDSPEAALRGRQIIQGVFLNEVAGHGCVIQTTDATGAIVAQSWWSHETPMDIWGMLAFVWRFLTSTFYKGFKATGWRKVPYGIKLLASSMMAVPKDEKGNEVPHLMLHNVGTAPGSRKSGHAAAHMLLGVAASEALGIPIKGCLISKRHMKPLVEVAGFVDMGPLLTPEADYPYYHWAIRWPTGNRVTIEQAKALLSIK
ncbi:MAG: hypothetical protein ABIA83_00435 [Patescibacteria group bacterium]